MCCKTEKRYNVNMMLLLTNTIVILVDALSFKVSLFQLTKALHCKILCSVIHSEDRSKTETPYVITARGAYIDREDIVNGHTQKVTIDKPAGKQILVQFQLEYI